MIYTGYDQDERFEVKQWNIFPVPASSVLVLTETGLGSPTPTLFLAKTRNSYSTQALRSTTVAVRVFPSIISGTGEKTHKHTHSIYITL